ncbi:MAG TPA: 5'-nucleotidase C-terminal domain-containing protein, partial [Pyrinomonadaceae bacterium]|nr:5'-nucleotidase C-terminal domain-containing protein [Pyrinomonadaceae bacterium]
LNRVCPRVSPRRIALASVVLLTVILAVGLATSGLRLAAAQEQRECPVRVTLLQVNDVYQFAPVDGGTRGGLARVLTLRKQIMSESPHTLFFLAGDTLSPSIESNTYKGKQMIEAWNAGGLDYATFGNHEFDFGPDVLRKRMGESHFKWLAANVIDKKTGKLFGDTPEFVVREFDGVKIGIFGILLQETLQTSRPGPDVDILDPCATAARVIPKIHAAGAQVIIALTHLSMGEDKRLARCSGVDLIIGGHEHTLLESMSGHAPIFKMTSDARELGRIDLNISKSTGKLESIDWQVIPVTDKVKDDPAFAPLNEKYGPLLKSLEQVVGRTEVELDIKSADVRTQETNMGDFIADAFRQATGADVALVNGGSIRADTIIEPGILTKRDVLSILPFNNRVVKLQLTGAVIRTVFEHGVASIGEEAQPGRFPQVSGLRYEYDARRKPGARVTSITINGKPLDDRRTYTLATTSYVAIDAGDGYDMFRNAPLVIRPEQAPSETDILLKAIASAPAIGPKTDGRIKRIDAAKDQGSCN